MCQQLLWDPAITYNLCFYPATIWAQDNTLLLAPKLLLTVSTFHTNFLDNILSSANFILSHLTNRSKSTTNITNLHTDLIYLTARPKSAIAHWPFLFTRMFLLLMSRCAIAGLPRVPNISVWRCATPLAAERARRRSDDRSSTCVWR
jgi:hypothetical protein